MNRPLTILIGGVLTAMGGVSSAFSGTFDETLDELVRIAPEAALLVKSAEAAGMAARAETVLPDPELEGEHLWGRESEENRWSASLSWGLEWPGVYRARRSVASAEEAKAFAETQIRLRDLKREVAVAMIDYLTASKRLAVVESQLTTTDSIAILADKAVSMGQMSALDRSKLRIERGLLISKRNAEIIAKEEAIASLISVAGEKGRGIIGSLVVEFPRLTIPSESECVGMAKDSPEVLSAQAETELAMKRYSLTGREMLPGVSVGYVHSYEEGTHFNGGNIGVSIPIFSGWGKRKAANAEKEVAGLNESVVRDRLIQDVVQIRHRLVAIEESLDELRDVFDLTAPLEQLQKAYSLGQMTLIDYLTERNYYLDTELEYISLAGEYHRLYRQLP